MSKKISIGIIGTGNMGNIHAKILDKIHGVKLKGFCNRTINKAEDAKKLFGGEYATSEPDKIFSDPDINTVYICTRHDSHVDLCTKAAKAGKNIFVEKPLALTVKECKQIVDVVEKSGVQVMIGFCLRFYPVVQQAHKFLPKPQLIFSQMIDNKWQDDLWVQDPIEGGGNVLSQGCHTIDLLCYLACAHPIRIFAEGGNYTHPNHPYPDHMIATIYFENGAKASWIQGDIGVPPYTDKFFLEMFEKNHKSVQLFDRFKQGIFRVGDRIEQVKRSGEEGLEIENLEFIHHLRENRPMPCNVWDGLLATFLLHKCFKAIETHQPQEIRWEGKIPVLDLE
ncbi:hypothetical protein COY51_00705 [Candidatus Desantisbacteria bacterium CG_4_10_14_0_8_um_filter_39_17]|uniref:Gfo/Idh/MocA family oxidoreductase n=1 Tax=Candidatus Desantisbacteria bacterium CG_4_10_14_0_8_um_filter_39_17 TaxID=1974542 RepID=A0A2H9PCY3_9BACT|nr:MAG: hypothetical protein COY51_00705 [Candidatus Desantisbacteria bacterium CG_4_10_14_0_8_um_filter_39_17]